MADKKSPIDSFFELGNKATQGDPVRKAYFDYCLYWVIFITFIGLSGSYFYNFFVKNLPFSQFLWGCIILIFSWFNYWALISFRMAYKNMKAFYSKPKEITQDNGFKEAFS